MPKSTLVESINVADTHPSSTMRAAVNASSSRRTATGRAIRTNATRPTNYYARPFGSSSATSAANNLNHGETGAPHTELPVGFFPALQYFSDAITALPKEVMRQFTLMKEVEAKIHAPNERLRDMLDTLVEVPVPMSKNAQALRSQHGLLSLTASNSTMGSTSASLVNGIAPNPVSGHYAARASLPGLMDGEEESLHESEEELLRRKHYLELRLVAQHLLPNLDEKNVVLAEANRVLELQLLRVDSVLPHVYSEIAEEARLGSMTHWAYSDNRQKKHAVPTAAHSRGMAAVNNLAAAANEVHETEIAQARRDAGREATREKHKGRGKEHFDSDFDDRPKKTHTKVAKVKVMAQPSAAGLGIPANGETVKRRKVDKGMAAPAMERSMSSNMKATKATRETPRSTPVVEPGKKTAKPKPAALSKKKLPNSVQNSPALMSSPPQSPFNPASVMEPPSTMRPQSGRLRGNSSATKLRHERLANEEDIRPDFAAGRNDGTMQKANGKRKAHDLEEQDETAEREHASKTTEIDTGLKREDAEGADADLPSHSRSASHSARAGRASTTGTPRTDNLPEAVALVRTRSTRSVRNDGRDSSSSEPQQQVSAGPRRHTRHISNSHLVKQLAPFNRSPDLDRHRGGSENRELEGLGIRNVINEADVGGEEVNPEDQTMEGRRSERKSVSRRNTLTANHAVPSPPASDRAPVAEEAADEEMRAGHDEPAQELHQEETHDQVPEPERELGLREDDREEEEGEAATTHLGIASSVPDLEEDTLLSPHLQDQAVDYDGEEEDEDEDGSEHDPDDPDEPKYCYCNRGSYGEMVACDNEECASEWFHLGCTELMEAPGEEEKWYCRNCRPLFEKPIASIGPARGRGKGRGRGGGG